MGETQTPKYIAIRQGMEEDDDLNPPPGTIVEARNVRFSADGAATPRPGSAAIPPTTVNNAATILNNAEDIGALPTIGSVGAMLLAGTVFAWDSTALTWETRGNYSTCLPVRKRESMALLADSYGYRRYGMAVNALGHVCMACTPAGSGVVAQPWVQITITSADGIRQFDTQISLPVGPGTSRKAAVLAFGNNFVLFTQDGVNVSARTLTYNAGGWTVSGATVVATLNAATNFWDVCAESPTRWYIVYQSGLAQATVDKRPFPVAAVLNTVNFAVVGQPGYSVYSDATNVWIGFNDNPTVVGNVTLIIYTTALALVLAPVVVSVGPENGPLVIGPARDGSASGKAFACCSYTRAAATPYSIGTLVFDLNTAGLVSFYNLWHVRPLSKPGSFGRIWVVASSRKRWSPSSPLGWQQSRSLLLRFPDPQTVDIPAPSTTLTPFVELATDTWEGITDFSGSSSAVDTRLLPEMNGPNSTFMLLPDIAQTVNGNDTVRLQVYEYERSSVVPWRDVAELSSTAIVAGQPIEVGAKGSSGTRFANQAQRSGVTVGWAHRPAIVNAVQGALGALTPGATYSWAIVYEWIDPETGRLHQSEPSAAYTATMGGANTSVTFTFHGITIDQRCSDPLNPPVVAMYRTTANGAQLRRETTFGTVQSAVAETITQQSNVADAALGDFLYTEEGVIPFNLAPSCRFVRRCEGNLIFAGLWDRRLIQQSRDFFPGEPVTASDLDSWKIYLPEDCEGIAYQDGIRYAFSKRAVYMVTGAGPNEQGQGDFDPVRTLTSEFGCISSPSICETSLGVFFLSPRGFMIIPRGGGSPQFIGAPVQKSVRRVKDDGTTGYYICIGAAAVTGNSRTVRFLMSNGSAEVVWVFDLDRQAWEYDTYRQSDPGPDGDAPSRLASIGRWRQVASGATGVVGDRCAIARRDLTSAALCLYLEDDSIFSDGQGDASIVSYVRFAEMRPFGLMGWGRCQSLGYVMFESFTDAVGKQVTGTVTPDALTTSATSRDWIVTSPGGNQTIYRSIDEGHQQCTFVQVEWSAARPKTAAAPGPSLNGLMMLTVAERGMRLLPPAER